MEIKDGNDDQHKTKEVGWVNDYQQIGWVGVMTMSQESTNEANEDQWKGIV